MPALGTSPTVGWLGFSEKTIKKYLDAAEFERPVMTPLPAEEHAKGPSLFVATAKKKL